MATPGPNELGLFLFWLVNKVDIVYNFVNAKYDIRDCVALCAMHGTPYSDSRKGSTALGLDRN